MDILFGSVDTKQRWRYVQATLTRGKERESLEQHVEFVEDERKN